MTLTKQNIRDNRDAALWVLETAVFSGRQAISHQELFYSGSPHFCPASYFRHIASMIEFRDEYMAGRTSDYVETIEQSVIFAGVGVPLPPPNGAIQHDWAQIFCDRLVSGTYILILGIEQFRREAPHELFEAIAAIHPVSDSWYELEDWVYEHATDETAGEMMAVLSRESQPGGSLFVDADEINTIRSSVRIEATAALMHGSFSEIENEPQVSGPADRPEQAIEETPKKPNRGGHYHPIFRFNDDLRGSSDCTLHRRDIAKAYISSLSPKIRAAEIKEHGSGKKLEEYYINKLRNHKDKLQYP